MDIREIRSVDELHAVEALQRDVWGVTDLEVLPAIHMIAAREVGAIILGAFDRGEMIGFVYGFPGFEGEHRVIHSDMLAVRETYRDHGVGRALKRAQRDAALARGVNRITWTFDPMQARNAYLNFAILGVTANRYLRDFYGMTTSPLHAQGTDRLWVTWNLKGQAEARPHTSARIEISAGNLRHAFERAFADGFVVTGFERPGSYILTRT